MDDTVDQSLFLHPSLFHWPRSCCWLCAWDHLSHLPLASWWMTLISWLTLSQLPAPRPWPNQTVPASLRVYVACSLVAVFVSNNWESDIFTNSDPVSILPLPDRNMCGSQLFSPSTNCCFSLLAVSYLFMSSFALQDCFWSFNLISSH